MKAPNWILSAAAICGALSVLTGAFAAHGLKAVLSSQQMGWIETGVLYQHLHSLALLALGLAVWAKGEMAFKSTAICWVLGILLFSGSLYALALSGWRFLVFLTPIGGLSFVAGWLLLTRNAAQQGKA